MMTSSQGESIDSLRSCDEKKLSQRREQVGLGSSRSSSPQIGVSTWKSFRCPSCYWGRHENLFLFVVDCRLQFKIFFRARTFKFIITGMSDVGTITRKRSDERPRSPRRRRDQLQSDWFSFLPLYRIQSGRVTCDSFCAPPHRCKNRHLNQSTLVSFRTNVPRWQIPVRLPNVLRIYFLAGTNV
jgi:hypothetical protein